MSRNLQGPHMNSFMQDVTQTGIETMEKGIVLAETHGGELRVEKINIMAQLKGWDAAAWDREMSRDKFRQGQTGEPRRRWKGGKSGVAREGGLTPPAALSCEPPLHATAGGHRCPL